MKNKSKTIVIGIVSAMIILTLFLIVTLLFKLIKKEHDVEYKIDEYNIVEKFQTDHYILKIRKDKNTYLYVLDNKLGKKKKIIKNIKTIEKNDLQCIIPKYKKNVPQSVYCNLNNKQVSINYLIQTENVDYLEMKTQLKKNKIKISEIKEKKSTYKKLDIFQDNFSDEKVVLWDYKGIYVIGKNSKEYQKILKKDLYDNLMSTVVDKYYVLFENTSVNGIETIYYYDLNNKKLKSFKLDKKISKKSYINGVVGNLIYITDKEKKKEYTLDIKHQKLTEIDNNQTEYIVYKNNKMEKLSKSDFLMNEQYFDNYSISNKNIESNDIREEGIYNYYTIDGNFYKSVKGYEEYPTLLFNLYDVKEWFIMNDTIYLTRQDCIYSYNNDGLKKMIQYNELRYNYKKIYNVWKK